DSDATFEAGGDAVYEAIWRGETQHLERSHVRKDGTRIWCSISGRAVRPGDPSQGSVWLWEDITQEREAEERIERALAEQELILDNATVGISFVRQRSFQRCNPRFEQMFGYGPGEPIGQGTRAIYTTQEEYERDVAWYDEMRDGRSVSAEREYRRKDGTTFWCKLVGKAIDPAAPREGSIWIYDDVTIEHEA